VVNAGEEREVGDRAYYLLEYLVKAARKPGAAQHRQCNRLSGQAFAFNASTSRERWDRMKDLLTTAAKSSQLTDNPIL
jgi:photosystem II oxygen-evolving enhancer protein 2